jgi:hypothetical protein
MAEPGYLQWKLMADVWASTVIVIFSSLMKIKNESSYKKEPWI